MIKKVFSFLWRVFFIFLIVLFIAAHFFEEIYVFAAGKVALPIRNFYSAICNRFPFSVFEIGAMLFLLSIPFIVWRFIKGKGSLSPLTVALQFFLVGYIITLGINSARPIKSDSTTLTDEKYIKAAELIVDELNSISSALPAGYSFTYTELSLSVDRYATERLGISYTHMPRVKKTALEKLLTDLGVLAYYSPVSAEITVNGELPEFMIPQVAAHELMHYFGITREDEATFHSFVLARESLNSSLSYSAHVAAFSLVASRVYQTAPEAYFEIIEDLAPRVKKDIAERQSFVYKMRDNKGVVINDFTLSVADERGKEAYNEAASLIAEYMLENAS